ncbi:MAG TPA: acyl-CoA dehydrogenase family protein [Acidimicrobiales bacterium]
MDDLGAPLDQFRAEARVWLERHAKPKPTSTDEFSWGVGSDSVALFQNMSEDQERAHIDAYRAWIREKAAAGWANLRWETEWGGRDLPREYEVAFAEEESRFVTPPRHEAIRITIDLMAPTIRAFGTPEQHVRFLRPTLRTDLLWCQLFSEPGAGSDLAAVATRATADGDEWVINGQKVWTSGAQFADWGYIICRSDIDAPKHRGLTAFVVPMKSAGIEVRPLRQMTGGASFNEVFLTDVRVPDSSRLGEPGDGWRAALTTLGFERSGGGSYGGTSTFRRLAALAQHLGRGSDPVVRQLLARVYTHQRLQRLNSERVRARSRRGDIPGPEGSIGKLFWTEGLQLVNDLASVLLGPRLAADTGEWGMYAWGEHLHGSAGYRIAAGTDEIQRNILSERILGLPSEPRADRDVPFSQTCR